MNSFERLNPIVAFIYFMTVIFFGIVFMHPTFLLVSVLGAFISNLILNSARLCNLLKYQCIIFLAIAVINPLFNSRGETVLFYYLNHRQYTFEALAYGCIMAMIFLTVLNWFECYSKIITSDKFIYIFGKIFPSSSFLLTMVMRFIPLYNDKLNDISNTRKCIGKGVEQNNFRSKVSAYSAIISSLVAVSLENSITVSVSMKSRGYGLPNKTQYAKYLFTKKDIAVLIIVLLSSSIIAFAWITGATNVDIIPRIIFQKADAVLLIGLLAYMILSFMPITIYLMEELKWNILKSKI